MDELIQWLGANKEWIFSGSGIALVAWIGRVFLQRRKAALSQEIQSGSNSKNIQAGRDLRIESNTKKSDVEEQ